MTDPTSALRTQMRLKAGLVLLNSFLTTFSKWVIFKMHYSSEYIHRWNTEWIQWEIKRIWGPLPEMSIYMYMFSRVTFVNYQYNTLFNPFLLSHANILETAKLWRWWYQVCFSEGGVGENEVTFSEIEIQITTDDGVDIVPFSLFWWLHFSTSPIVNSGKQNLWECYFTEVLQWQENTLSLAILALG